MIGANIAIGNAETQAGVPGLPFAFNFAPGAAGNLSHWRTDRDAVKAGSARAKILFISDSKTFAGAGTTDGSTFTVGAFDKTVGKYLNDALIAGGVQATWQSFVGWMGLATEAQLKNYDTRLGGLASWVVGDLTVGGRFQQSAPANVDVYSFAPTAGVKVDTVEVGYEKGAARGSFTLSDGSLTGSGTIVTTNATSSWSFSTVTLSSLAAGKTVSINRLVSVVQAIMVGTLVAYDSTVKAVDIVPAFFFGSQTSDWVSTVNPWSPGNFGAIGAHLTIIQLGSNDLRLGVSTFAATGNLQTLITKALAVGDCILLNPSTGSQPTWGTAAAQAARTAANYTLAVTNNIPLIDMDALTGGGQSANPSAFADVIHELAATNQKEANAIAAMLLAA